MAGLLARARTSPTPMRLADAAAHDRTPAEADASRAVHGAGLGGGMGLVAACDIAHRRRRGRSSRLSEVRLGLIPAVISPYVIRAIGARPARRYFLTAERFDAAEAQRIGLVHEVVPAERT